MMHIFKNNFIVGWAFLYVLVDFWCMFGTCYIPFDLSWRAEQEHANYINSQSYGSKVKECEVAKIVIFGGRFFVKFYYII